MGGSSGQTSSTVYQSNLPEYAKPYFEDILKRSQKQSLQPYQAYNGQRIANQSGMTNQSYQNLQQLSSAGLPGINDAMSIYRDVNGQANQMANYQANGVTSNYNAQNFKPSSITAQNINPNQYGQFANSDAQTVTAGQWNGQQADQYMNPYMQKVLDVQKNQAMLDYQRAQIGRNDQAVAAGAFGDSRHGVVDALSQESLLRNMSDIQATGMNNAWTQAQNMFSGDRNAQLSADQGNQSADLTARQLGIQSLGQRLTAQQANQGANLTAQQQSELARQFGANFNNQSMLDANTARMNAQAQTEQFRQSGQQLGLGALQQQQAAAQGLVGAQGAYTGQRLDISNALAAAGQQQQQYGQSKLDMAYNDFVNQRDYGKQNLNFYNSMLHGVPVSANTDVSQYQNVNPFSQLLGAGLGSLGLQGQQ